MRIRRHKDMSETWWYRRMLRKRYRTLRRRGVEPNDLSTLDLLRALRDVDEHRWVSPPIPADPTVSGTVTLLDTPPTMPSTAEDGG